VLSTLRIAGLASGMDTESIIKDLMRAHRMPVDRLQQNRQILEWQQEDNRAINTALRSFRDQVFNMRLQSTYLAKSASVSNESVLKATAGSNAIPGSYAVEVTQLAKGVTKGSVEQVSDEDDGNGNIQTLKNQFVGIADSITFKLEGSKNEPQAFTFNTNTDTIYDVVSKINNADIGIKASYDADQNRIFLTSETTGDGQKIKVLEDASNFVSYDPTASQTYNDSFLKLDLKINSDEYIGLNAKINIGDAQELESSTNSITVNGITMNLNAKGTTTINVSNDTDAVFNSIISLIDNYNTTVETITDKLYEKRYSDYQPLTNEQREELTDDQIEKWEEKARSGLLRNDPILSGVVSSMRQTMSSVVSGLGGNNDTLADLGIKTSIDYMSAKLVVDENKLREALQQDPDGVMKLFTNTSDIDAEKGIARRLYDNVNNAMTQISQKAGSYNEFSQVDDSLIGEKISDIDTRINNWEHRLVNMEDRYWRQFTAMEKAIQQMNSQSMWLMQQFGGGQQ